MNLYELAARLAVYSEMTRSLEANYVVLSQSTNDSTLLKLMEQMEAHCDQSAQWGEKATRYAFALARKADEDRAKLTNQLNASIHLVRERQS